MRIPFVYNALALLLASVTVWAVDSDDPRMDRPDLSYYLAAGDEALARANASILSKGSDPVGVEGNLLLRLRGHRYTQYPDYIYDTAWVYGEESGMEIKFAAKPHRHASLWSGIKFYTNWQGGMRPNKVQDVEDDNGFMPLVSHHDDNPEALGLDGDFYAGMAFNGPYGAAFLRLGGIIWVKSSPLSMWAGSKTISIGDEKEFGWTRLPWEDDKPVAEWYQMRVLKGERFGEAASRWNKQAFRGVDLELTGLPGDLYINTLFAPSDVPARWRTFATEFVDHPDTKEKAYDKNHFVAHLRASWGGIRELIGPGAVVGLNYTNSFYNANVQSTAQFKERLYTGEQWKQNGTREYFYGAEGQLDSLQRGVYNNRQHFTLDLQGTPVKNKLEYIVDVGVQFVDSTIVEYRYTPSSILIDEPEIRTKQRFILPALYGRIRSEFLLPLQLEAAFTPPEFHSYNSFPTNIWGVNASYRPTFGQKGRLKLSYGFHTEMRETDDLLVLPYRLNGSDASGMFLTTYGRWGFGELDATASAQDKYNPRIGNEAGRSYQHGAIRGNYMAMAETFVAYENEKQASINTAKDTAYSTRDSILVRRAQTPTHQKWAFNLKAESAYDIGDLLGLNRSVLMNFFAQVSGIDKQYRVASFSQKNLMLWSSYFRLEPAIAITPGFYLLFMGGFEWWKSDMAYMQINDQIQNVPLDFRDYALGIGFDIDVSPRVGFHGRFKWTSHEDVNYSANNWENYSLLTEMAVFF